MNGIRSVENKRERLTRNYPMLRDMIKDTLVAVVLVGSGIWILRGKSLPLKTTSKEESDEQTNA